jgi:hypothetical protein
MNNSQENLYRLIKPYDSNLLHTSSTMMGGASKCYKELKKTSPIATNFSIMHMKTNQIYDFDINNINQNVNQTGGNIATLSEMEQVRNYVTSLEKRIIDLENKINGNRENIAGGSNGNDGNDGNTGNTGNKIGGSVINNHNVEIPMLNDAPIPPHYPKQHSLNLSRNQPIIMNGGITPPMMNQNMMPNMINQNMMPNMINQNMMPNMMNPNMMNQNMMPNMMNNNFNHNIARKFI